MFLIYRHLLTATAGPFLFGLFVITFLMMIEILFKYVDLFVSKGVPFVLATKVLLLSLGHTFALSVPMAVLIGILMGVGQLAADQEITALKASGVGLAAILRPLLLGAALIASLLTAYNHWIFPESNHTLANLVYDINRKKPMLEIRERQFTDLSEGMTIYVGAKDDLTGHIEDVVIIEREKPTDISPRMTIARWGTILPDHANDAMLIELHEGEIHENPDPAVPDKYQVTRFGQHNLQVANVERDFRESGRKARSDREMNITDLWEAAGDEARRADDARGLLVEQAGGVLRWQWQLLDPERRDDLLGVRPAPAPGRARAGFMEPKFRATRLKVERTVEQAGYQEKVVDSFRIKRNRYMVELHKKFAIPFACVVFTLLGLPMAVTSSRAGKGVSVSLAIAVYLVYYLFLVGGEKFADRGRLDPALAMWAANIVLVAVGIPMFLKAVRESSLLGAARGAVTLTRGRRRPAGPTGGPTG